MIILLGFPKSGTSSFNTLFENLGYQSFHWKYKNEYIGELIKKNKINNKKLLSFINKKDYNNTAITQMDVCMNKRTNYWPQLLDYKRLYYENKDAIFILNKRNPYKIIKSMKKWKNEYGEIMFDRIIKYNSNLLIKNNNISNENKILYLINNHYNTIENFFHSLLNVKFIIYNIDSDHISKLNKYINVYNNKFPHENSRLEKMVLRIITYTIFIIMIYILYFIIKNKKI